ncbi:MAG: hypothetical protein H0W72_15280 [Planctomycetes bacterium]|nr:hypothetical protein [Planctomycetota bacterium]
MKRTGCLILVLAMLSCLAGSAVIGFAVVSAFTARRVEAKAFAGGRAEVMAALDPGHLAQVALEMSVRVPRPAGGPQDPSGFVAVYRFPLRYQVSDAAGTVLFSEDSEVRSDRGSRTTVQRTLDQAVGVVAVQHWLGKFPAPAAGAVRVTATLGTDVDGKATAEGAALVLYDRVASDNRSIAVAFVLVIGGLVAAVLGVVLFVAGRRAR